MADEPPKGPAFAGDFLLGEWLVHPSVDRLSRGDTVVHLRRQLTDLLLLLARHAGETLPRERILEEIWGTQYVGESALTRCVTELRQALHDDAHAPKLIETIPRRGYRLVGPVVFLSKPAPAVGDPAGAEAPPPATGQIACEAAESRAGAVGDGGPPAAGGPERGGFMRRARWTALKVAVVVGLAVAVGAGDWTAPPVVPGRDSVLLADVVNTTGDRVFDDALRLALAVNLEQAPFLRVLPRERMRGALVRMGRSPDDRCVGPIALDVCRREGAAVLLVESIAALGSRYAIGIEAFACGTGESVGRALGQADDREHVLSVLEHVATRIRVKLGESHASLQQHSIPLVQATTASLEALEALTLGDENRDHSRVGEALDFYRQATELDPGFALAWARRGAAAVTLDLGKEGISAFRRAYELREKVSQPERFYIEAHYYGHVAADPQKAIDSYRAWKRMYPGSLVPATNLASILAGFFGQYDAALVEAREAVRLGRYSSIARATLVLAYLGSGRIPEARQALAEAAKVGVSDRIIHYYSRLLALFDDDAAAIAREVEWAAGDPAAALETLRTRAAAATSRGRLREARGLWAEAVRRAREFRGESLASEVRLAWAESEAVAGDPRRARTLAQAALAEDQSPTTQLDAAIVFALVGDSARARSLLDAVTGQAALDSVHVLAGLPLARALVESNCARNAEAAAALQPVARFENGAEFGLAPLGVRGLVALSAHKPSEAAAAFQAVLGRRVMYPASPWGAYARLALARALREMGETARSVAAYDDFLASWKGADRDAPLLNAALRERAAFAGN